MVALDIKCRRCGASVMDNDHELEGLPSVHLRIGHEGEMGDVWLSSLYGSPTIECSLDIPDGDLIDLHCPSCRRRFRHTRRCGQCQAPTKPRCLAQ